VSSAKVVREAGDTSKKIKTAAIFLGLLMIECQERRKALRKILYLFFGHSNYCLAQGHTSIKWEI
jgi:hypothetical protein